MLSLSFSLSCFLSSYCTSTHTHSRTHYTHTHTLPLSHSPSVFLQFRSKVRHKNLSFLTKKILSEQKSKKLKNQKFFLHFLSNLVQYFRLPYLMVNFPDTCSKKVELKTKSSIFLLQGLPNSKSTRKWEKSGLIETTWEYFSHAEQSPLSGFRPITEFLLKWLILKAENVLLMPVLVAQLHIYNNRCTRFRSTRSLLLGMK